MGKVRKQTYKMGDATYELCRDYDENGARRITVFARDEEAKRLCNLRFETEKKALRFILSAFREERGRRCGQKVDLNSLTWDKIADYAESGEAAQIFEIGDIKDFTLTTGEQCRAVILDFNHDHLTSDEEATAGITFGMLNCLEGAYVMNNEWTNEGGYVASKMYETVKSVFYEKLPDDMKKHIKCVQKNEGAKEGQFYAMAFPFSEVEVFGTADYSYEGEGRQYPFYEKEENRIKKLGENGEACSWWLRSPRSTYSTAFCYVYSDGTLSGSSASYARGLSAGFCI